MLNKRPIFVNGFQRGGTNILMRLISSHPRVRILGAEIHELFYGRERETFKKWGRRLTYAPVLLAARQHIFWPYRLEERRSLPVALHPYLDALFYLYKQEADNSHAGQAVPQTWAERGRARMVCKCVNGVALNTLLFSQMYPDATFIALVRNGLALCEGFMRRGWSAARIGNMYHRVGCRMLQDDRQMDNYHIVRFEDLLADPAGQLSEIYHLLGLDVAAVEKFKLQAKKSMGKDGTRGYTFGREEKVIQWLPLHQLSQYLRQDVNENQIARLSAADKQIFLAQAKPVMDAFGYLT